MTPKPTSNKDVVADINMAIANIKEDFTVPKVAIEAATSVIQTGSSCGGYREAVILAVRLGYRFWPLTKPNRISDLTG